MPKVIPFPREDLADTRRENYDALPPRLRSGDMLDPYCIEGEVARGGTAAIYRAHSAADGRVVALKVLSPHLGLVFEAVARFKAEAKLAGRVRHPCVIPIYQTGKADGHYYFATELHSGETAEHLSAKTVSGGGDFYHHIAGLFAGVARALDDLHGQGIVHRDVKPENLLVGEDGLLILCDFGSALDSRNRSPILERTLWGTPRYMSPEQFLSDADPYDPLNDVYALGLTLYEIVTEAPAFPKWSLKNLVHFKLTRRPPVPRHINSDIPLGLDAIIRQAIEPNPRMRYLSMHDLAEDLERFATLQRGR